MSEKCPIIAIDPGNRQSAYCVIDCNTLRPLEFGKVDNEELRNKLVFANEQGWQWAAIEMVASYGMAVGREGLIPSSGLGVSMKHCPSRWRRSRGFSAASKKSGTSAMTAGQMTRPSGGR